MWGYEKIHAYVEQALRSVTNLNLGNEEIVMDNNESSGWDND